MADQVAHSSESVPQMDEKVRPDIADNSKLMMLPVLSIAILYSISAPSTKPRRSNFILRFNIIVLVLVLVASGLVPVRELLFVGFASAYFVAFGRFVYPCPTKEHPASVFPNNRLLSRYVAFAGLIAIPATMAYILGSFVKGDQEAMRAAAPHLFLMACQVLSEITVVSLSTPVSLPVRMMVPVFYNTRRLFTISVWMETEFARTTDDKGSWLLFGRGLAVANMAIWAFNLFCFLLPVYLPLVMKKHNQLEKLSKQHQT